MRSVSEEREFWRLTALDAFQRLGRAMVTAAEAPPEDARILSDQARRRFEPFARWAQERFLTAMLLEERDGFFAVQPLRDECHRQHILAQLHVPQSVPLTCQSTAELTR